jgi:hypothetical protein
MPFTFPAKNQMLDSSSFQKVNPTLAASFAGGLTKEADTTVMKSTNSTTLEREDKASHVFAGGELVVLSNTPTGGTDSTNKTGGLVEGRIYEVEKVSATTIKLRDKSTGGTAISWTSEASNVKLAILKEIKEEGSPAYKRVEVATAAAKDGVAEDTAEHVLNMPAGAVVDYVGYWSASTVGTLMAASSVTKESFAGQGTLTVKSSRFDLNGGV